LNCGAWYKIALGYMLHATGFMIIIDYNPKTQKQIIHACALALKKGKLVAYPTDTSYGLACDTTNVAAVNKLYRLKGRNFNKPVHVVVASKKQAATLTRWNNSAEKLSRKFWPGALTLVLPLKTKNRSILRLTSKTGFLGLRMPKNKIARDLAVAFKRPITATSANVSGKPDTYHAAEILQQFRRRKTRPDIILNTGILPKRKPSTIVKITPPSPPLLRGGMNAVVEILRQGPITKKQIEQVISSKL